MLEIITVVCFAILFMTFVIVSFLWKIAELLEIMLEEQEKDASDVALFPISGRLYD